MSLRRLALNCRVDGATVEVAWWLPVVTGGGVHRDAAVRTGHGGSVVIVTGFIGMRASYMYKYVVCRKMAVN